MTRMIAFAAALFLTIAPGAPNAQSAQEATAIEGVIRSQVEAMRADDWDRAFTFASPNIQRIFRDPLNFSEMVKRGYPMVWRPRQVEAGALTTSPRGYVQTMLFEDQSGRLYIADYLMQLVNGAWRINGVQIRPAQEGSA